MSIFYKDGREFDVSGIGTKTKNALIDIFRHVAYSDPNGNAYLDALESSMQNQEDNHLILEKINTFKSIYTTDPIDTVKNNIQVTYYETEEAEGVVLDHSQYTVTGTLIAGESGITVNYNGYTKEIILPVREAKYEYKLSLGDLQRYDMWANTSRSIPTFPSLENSSNRRTIASDNGYQRYGNGNTVYKEGAFLIPIPYDAKTISASITPASMYFSISTFRVKDTQLTHEYVLETGWKQGSASYIPEETPSAMRGLLVNVKQNQAGSDITTEPTEFIITFSK